MFTARPVAIGGAVGVLVATAFGLLVGVSWGLAILAGLPAGALAFAVSIGMRDSRFDVMMQRRLDVWTLAWTVVSAPAFLVWGFVAVRLDRDDEFVLGFLFLTTGLAAYVLGGIVATLTHLDGDDDADPRPHRVPPPPGERGGAS